MVRVTAFQLIISGFNVGQYEQINGIAMGSPRGSLSANTCMYSLETPRKQLNA